MGELLRLAVRLNGIYLGRPTDAIVDLGALRVLGLEVLCGDEVNRFLPFPAATVEEDEIALRSALTLLDESELAFYRERADSLSRLRGAELELDGRQVGRVSDLVVGPGGAVVGVVVEDGDAVRTVEVVGSHVRAASTV